LTSISGEDFCSFILLILEIADRVVMKRDLQIAREIQTWLLPGAPPQIPGISVAYATRPQTRSPAITTTYSRAPAKARRESHRLRGRRRRRQKHSRGHADGDFSSQPENALHRAGRLPELVANMNATPAPTARAELRFTTAFLAEYDAARRIFTYINAGHNNPILRRSNGLDRAPRCRRLATRHSCPMQNTIRPASRSPPAIG
jgi:phosphoserine phosphatase RsbU/P